MNKENFISSLTKISSPDGYWYDAKNVCEKLGYAFNKRVIANNVPESQKMKLVELCAKYEMDLADYTKHTRYNRMFINEQGLATLIYRSRKTTAAQKELAIEYKESKYPTERALETRRLRLKQARRSKLDQDLLIRRMGHVVGKLCKNKEKLDEFDHELTSSLCVKKHLQDTITELKEEKNGLENCVAEMKSDIDKGRKEYFDLQNSIAERDQVRAELQALKDEVAETRAVELALKEAKRILADRNAEIAERTEEIALMDADRRKLKTLVEELLTKARITEIGLDEMTKSLTEVRSQRDETVEKLEAVRGELSAANQQLSFVKAEQANIQAQTEKLEAVRGELSAANQQLSFVRAEIEQERRAAEVNLQIEMTKKKAEYDVVHSEYWVLKRKLDAVQHEIDTNSAVLETQKRDIAAGLARLDLLRPKKTARLYVNANEPETYKISFAKSKICSKDWLCESVFKDVDEETFVEKLDGRMRLLTEGGWSDIKKPFSVPASKRIDLLNFLDEITKKK